MKVKELIREERQKEMEYESLKIAEESHSPMPT